MAVRLPKNHPEVLRARREGRIVGERVAGVGYTGIRKPPPKLPPPADPRPVADVVRVDLPLCPTTNNLYTDANGRKGRVKSAAYRAWIEAADKCLAGLPRCRTPAAVWIVIVPGPGFTLACDAFNREKATTDLLVAGGILPGDSIKYVRGGGVWFAHDLPPAAAAYLAVRVEWCGE
jgi:hypothetical protein